MTYWAVKDGKIVSVRSVMPSALMDELKDKGVSLIDLLSEHAQEQKKEKEMNTPDIVIRDAAGAVLPTRYAHPDLAFAACPAGGSMTFAPRAYTHSQAGPTGAPMISVNKRCKWIGTTVSQPSRMYAGVPMGGGTQVGRTTFNWRVQGDNQDMFLVRTGAGIGQVAVPDSGAVFERIAFVPERSPKPGAGPVALRDDYNVTCMRIHSGDIGSETRCDVRDCEFANAAGGIAIETPQEGQVDSALACKFERCIVRDMYEQRDPSGVPPTDANAQGWYFGGGIVELIDCTTERIGYIEGSTIYTPRNKSQGKYGRKGTVTMTRCKLSKMAHAAIQARGITLLFTDLEISEAPIGLAVGHKQNANEENVSGVSEATGTGYTFRKPRAFVEPATGNATLSTALWFDRLIGASISDIDIDGTGGEFGGWAAINFSDTPGALISLTDVSVRNWSAGIEFDQPVTPGGSTTVENLVVQNCTIPWRILWPNEDFSGPAEIGGEWINCTIGAGFDPYAQLP